MWLSTIENSLPENYAAELEALSVRFGKLIRLRGFTIDTKWGRKAPITAKDLLDHSNEELLKYLKEWLPTGDSPIEDSRAGLGDEFKRAVGIMPERFAKLARSFRELHSHYVAVLLWGLHEIVSTRTDAQGIRREGPSIDWSSVLDLAESTIVGGVAGRKDDQEDSIWARQMAADIAWDIVRDARVQDFYLVERAVTLINLFLDDPDPSSERVKSRGSDDIGDFALGTVRGQALYSAISAAVYLREHGSATFAHTVSHLINALERRALQEPSEAICRVFGEQFSRLVAVDKKASTSIGQNVFYDRSGIPNPASLAWHRYLSTNPAYVNAFEILKPLYVTSIESVSFLTSGAATDLGTHLIWLAAFGTEEVAKHEGLLSQFAQTASPDARSAAARHLGRALLNTTEALPPKDVDHLMACWELWESCIPNGAEDLAAFGWWFSSNVFQANWALARLERVLYLTGGRIEWSNGVIERLASLAEEFPLEVAKAIELLIESPDWDRNLLAGEKPLQATLKILRRGPAHEKANAAISRLEARGWNAPDDLK